MTNVLVDLHTADGLFRSNVLPEQPSGEDQRRYYLNILEANGTTQAQFDSSLVWYNRDPKRLDKVYHRVVKELEAQEIWIKEHPRLEILPVEILDFSPFKKEIERLYSINDFDSVSNAFEKAADSIVRHYKVVIPVWEGSCDSIIINDPGPSPEELTPDLSDEDPIEKDSLQ